MTKNTKTNKPRKADRVCPNIHSCPQCKAKIRRCIDCKRDLPIEYFYKRDERNFASVCKDCAIKRTQKWTQKNKERFNAYHRERAEKKRITTKLLKQTLGNLQSIEKIISEMRCKN